MAIRIGDDVRKELLESLRRFFREELDEEVGDLKAELVLGYLLEELAPVVYNQGVADAQAWMQGRLEDLDSSLWQPELVYWTRR